MSKTHPFDQALQFSGGPEQWQGKPSPAYANTVGPFGGITAAALLTVLLDHPQRLGDPLSLTVNYVAPIADEPFTIDTQLIRSNRSTQHWLVTLAQQGEAVANGTAVFAKRRETWRDTERTFPQMPPVETCELVPSAFMPPWGKNYSIWFEDGVPIFNAGEKRHSSETTHWMRDNPPRPLDFASLAAMCDIFFPRIFVRQPELVPVGTVSLTIYFHALAAQLAAHGEQLLIGQARANRFGSGYYDQSGEVWSPTGELFATTHQIVYYKA